MWRFTKGGAGRNAADTGGLSAGAQPSSVPGTVTILPDDESAAKFKSHSTSDNPTAGSAAEPSSEPDVVVSGGVGDGAGGARSKLLGRLRPLKNLSMAPVSTSAAPEASAGTTTSDGTVPAADADMGGRVGSTPPNLLGRLRQFDAGSAASRLMRRVNLGGGATGSGAVPVGSGDEIAGKEVGQKAAQRAARRAAYEERLEEWELKKKSEKLRAEINGLPFNEDEFPGKPVWEDSESEDEGGGEVTDAAHNDGVGDHVDDDGSNALGRQISKKFQTPVVPETQKHTPASEIAEMCAAKAYGPQKSTGPVSTTHSHMPQHMAFPTHLQPQAQHYQPPPTLAAQPPPPPVAPASAPPAGASLDSWGNLPHAPHLQLPNQVPPGNPYQHQQQQQQQQQQQHGYAVYSTRGVPLMPMPQSTTYVDPALAEKIRRGRELEKLGIQQEEQGNMGAAQAAYMKSLELLIPSLKELEVGNEVSRAFRMQEKNKLSREATLMLDRCEELKRFLEINSANAPSLRPKKASPPGPGSGDSNGPGGNVTNRTVLSRPPPPKFTAQDFADLGIDDPELTPPSTKPAFAKQGPPQPPMQAPGQPPAHGAMEPPPPAYPSLQPPSQRPMQQQPPMQPPMPHQGSQIPPPEPSSWELERPVPPELNESSWPKPPSRAPPPVPKTQPFPEYGEREEYKAAHPADVAIEKQMSRRREMLSRPPGILNPPSPPPLPPLPQSPLDDVRGQQQEQSGMKCVLCEEQPASLIGKCGHAYCVKCGNRASGIGSCLVSGCSQALSREDMRHIV